MTGAIVAILLGSGSIVVLIRMVFVRGSMLKSDAERKLWKKWLSVCCVGLFLLLVLPGALEIFGVVPIGSLGCAGAILFFFLLVRSGSWYWQRVSRVRAENQFEMNSRDFQFSADNRTTHLNGI